MTTDLTLNPHRNPVMPPWHLYLKYTAFATLSAFGLWVARDFWMWLLVAVFVWQVTGGKRPQ